jgi:hypothetical protein
MCITRVRQGDNTNNISQKGILNGRQSPQRNRITLNGSKQTFLKSHTFLTMGDNK